MSISWYLSEKDSPYETIRHTIETWANDHYYDDFLVTIKLNDRVETVILWCEDGSLLWSNDWWEGEKTELLGFVPIGQIRVTGGYHGQAIVETV